MRKTSATLARLITSLRCWIAAARDSARYSAPLMVMTCGIFFVAMVLSYLCAGPRRAVVKRLSVVFGACCSVDQRHQAPPILLAAFVCAVLSTLGQSTLPCLWKQRPPRKRQSSPVLLCILLRHPCKELCDLQS